MHRIAFRAAYYLEAIPLASTEAVRYYLHGAHLSGDGVLAATDGHAMIVAHVSHVPGDAIIPAGTDCIIPANADLVKHSREKNRDPHPRFLVMTPGDGLRVTIRVVFAPDARGALEAVDAGNACFTLETAFVDGTFPAYRKVIPAWPATVPASAPFFATKLLARFDAAAAGAGREKSGGAGAVRILATGGGDGAAIVDLGRPDAFGVIMPVRAPSGHKPDKVPPHPAWVRAAQAAAA